MTLYKQLLLYIATLLLLVFSVIFLVSIHNDRVLISKQLEVNTQNTASTLGMLLSIPMNKNNKTILLPLVNSLLNGGFYNAIEVLNDHSKIVLNQSINQQVKGVPDWLVNWFAIPDSSTHARAKTLNGQVVVTAFTGFAYLDFWHATLSMFWWMVGLYLLSVVLSAMLIKHLLRPLTLLSNQAEDFAKNTHISKTLPPKTLELRRVTEAMQNMSLKAQKKYEEERSLTERLHQQTYQETVTGLGNRRYFDMQLQHLISEKIALGALFLIEVQGLKQYNDNLGYEAGDLLIQRIAKVITENCQDIKANFLSRIGGSTFALLTPHLSDEEVEHLATCLIQGVEALLTSDKDTDIILVHVGITSLAGITEAAKALTYADVALKAAQAKGPYAYQQYENENTEPGEISSRNASEWKKYIDKIIAEQLVTVAYQPIMNFPNKKPMAYEALLRVRGVEKAMSEARFIIPLADRYGLTYALDHCVIEQVLQKAKGDNSGIPYIINLSASTLNHQESLDYLKKQLATDEFRNKLIFELDEHTVLNNLDQVRTIAKQFKEYGVDMAVEHYGHDFASFDCIKNLHLLYLKIDGSFIRDLNHQDSQFYINFLTKVAHTVGMKVLAECLETEDQWKYLNLIQIDGAQGRYLAPPENEQDYLKKTAV